MLNNPNIGPSTSIDCWIVSILTFYLELRHIPSKIHRPDGLSRWLPQPGDLTDKEDDKVNFNNWVDNLYGFLHLLNLPTPKHSQSSSCIHLSDKKWPYYLKILQSQMLPATSLIQPHIPKQLTLLINISDRHMTG